MGVATQSQAFAVGNSVPFALPGHGVIATQSMAEPMYGAVGLDLLQGGFTAQEVLTALSSVDPHPERRQVAVLGVNGDLAAYTGVQCAGRPPPGRHVRGAGQHGQLGAGVGGDGRVVRVLRRPAGPAAAHRPARGRGCRGRLPRPAVRGDHGHPRDDDRPPVARHGGQPARRRLRRPAGRPGRPPDHEGPLPRRRPLLRAGDRRRPGHRRPGARPAAPDGPAHRARPADVARRRRRAGRPGGRAREMLTELAATVPQFLEAARRFGKAGLMPADVVDRIVPAPS